jgi:hypothetical protein
LESPGKCNKIIWVIPEIHSNIWVRPLWNWWCGCEMPRGECDYVATNCNDRFRTKFYICGKRKGQNKKMSKEDGYWIICSRFIFLKQNITHSLVNSSSSINSIMWHSFPFPPLITP